MSDPSDPSREAALSAGPQSALVAYDGSPDAKSAIRHAASLLGARPVVVLTVWRSARHVASAARLALPDDIVEGGVEGLDADAREAAESLAAEGAALARDAGVEAEPAALLADGAIAAAIVRAASERSAAVIVLGSRGRSEITSALLGGVAYGVLHAATQPVLAVSHASPDHPAGPVMLCYDGSVNEGRAIKAAARLFGVTAAVATHYRETIESAIMLRTAAQGFLLAEMKEALDELERAARDDARRVSEDGAALAREAGFRAEALAVSGDEGAWPALLRVADERDASVLVVGSRGRSGLASLVLGSVSHALLHRSRRPVLVVPPGDGDT